MSSRFGLVNILLLALVCCASTASGRDKAALKLDRHDLTVLGVTIGSSTQADVESHLGKAEVFSVGSGDEKENAVCYRSASNDDDTIVGFYFGALGGWTDVTRISISKSRALPWPSTRCKSNRMVSRNLEFLRGLKLGSASPDVIRALGHPSRSSKNRLYYYTSYHCEPGFAEKAERGKPSGDSPCDVVDSVEAKFDSQEGLIYVSFYHFID
jgi:hypothetical protein